MSIGEILGFFVFVGVVLAFSKYVLDRDIGGWVWERVQDAWDRVRR